MMVMATLPSAATGMHSAKIQHFYVLTSAFFCNYDRKSYKIVGNCKIIENSQKIVENSWKIVENCRK